MRRLVFDIETNRVDFNDLQSTLKTIHVIVVGDVDTKETWRFSERGSLWAHGTIQEGLDFLAGADVIIGHNIQEFDIPAIQVKYPNFQPRGVVRDTLIMSQLIFPDIKDRHFRFLSKNPDFPKRLIGTHKLEAWGHILGNYKDDFAERMEALGLDPWEELPPEYETEREDYCEQDVLVNMALFHRLMSKGFSEDSIQLEHDVARIIRRQERYGFAFDVESAVKLQGELYEERAQVERELKDAFGDFFVKNGKKKTFKKDMRRFIPNEHGRHEKRVGKDKELTRGYYEFVGGADPECPVNEFQPVKLVTFNPGSRDHIANRLKHLYGWKPKEFTDDGKAKVDETVLSGLTYPHTEQLRRYFLLNKRLGQLAEGNEAWLKCEINGRIYGKVNTMGAVTSRMTHSKPNVAQVPASYSEFGKECRQLFYVPEGKKLVGCDADALELRDLAGYMARWDGGDYIRAVLEGDKSKGTDIHTRNRDAIGLKERDTAKTWFYAFIYGAGDFKLGTIILEDMPEDKRRKYGKKKTVQLGKQSRAKFEQNLPALGKLVKRVKSAASKRKRVRGLDGRFHPVRSEHSALNTLLQGAGAILMKRGLVIADNDLQSKGYVPGLDYEFVANVHDEWQVEANEEIAEEVGKTMSKALEKAGEYYGFACPITGDYAIGNTWAETH